MHQDRISPDQSGPGQIDIEQEDAGWQAQVLALLLAEHPAFFAEAELRLLIVGDAPDFETKDAYERAVIDLIRAGLIYQHGPFLIPGRAVRIVDGLELD